MVKVVGFYMNKDNLPALPVANIKELMPLMPGEWVYRVTAGKAQGDSGRLHREVEKRGQKKLWRRMVRMPRRACEPHIYFFS